MRAVLTAFALPEFGNHTTWKKYQVKGTWFIELWKLGETSMWTEIMQCYLFSSSIQQFPRHPGYADWNNEWMELNRWESTQVVYHWERKLKSVYLPISIKIFILTLTYLAAVLSLPSYTQDKRKQGSSHRQTSGWAIFVHTNTPSLFILPAGYACLRGSTSRPTPLL